MEQNNKAKIDESIFAKSANISNLINYQENSIVSRTLLNSKSGTVTLFAFEESQALSEHTAPYDALVQIIEGKAEILIGGNSNILNAAEVIVMPGGIPHAVKAPCKFKMLLTMIKTVV